MLKLMYITNNPRVAHIAENVGVDRIFVDMEYIGKSDRQGGMDTVQSKHTLDDVKIIHEVLNTAELVVRVNPIHEATEQYGSSKEEIDGAIEDGADIIMLPFFKTINEVRKFIEYVDGRTKSMLLLETPEAVQILDEILNEKGIDEIHIGLNDLSLGYNKKFMFELLVDGTVETICKKINNAGINYGFGGIGGIGKGMLPAERIIAEHYRLGSTIAILSRSFCNTEKITELEVIEDIFTEGVKEIRTFEKEQAPIWAANDENKKIVRDIVLQINGK